MHTIILGLGNILCGDEGLGVRLAERLYANWDFGPHVEVVDGGTQGMPLLQHVEKTDRLLILDVVDFGLPPGELVVRHGDMPAWLTAKKMSAHQASFAEVLGMARFRGRVPEIMALVGMQPVDMGYGAPLSDTALQMLPELERQTLAVLREWGEDATPRETPRHLNAACLTYTAETCAC